MFPTLNSVCPLYVLPTAEWFHSKSSKLICWNNYMNGFLPRLANTAWNWRMHNTKPQGQEYLSKTIAMLGLWVMVLDNNSFDSRTEEAEQLVLWICQQGLNPSARAKGTAIMLRAIIPHLKALENTTSVPLWQKKSFCKEASQKLTHLFSNKFPSKYSKSNQISWEKSQKKLP